MQGTFSRISPYAGYVAVAGLVGAAFQYLLRHQLNEIGWALLAVGVVALIVFVVGNPQTVRNALGARSTKYGSNTIAMLLIFALIAGAVNYVVAQHNQTWDVTSNGQFTLSPQTVKLLQDLKEPVSVKAFFTDSYYNKKQAQDLLTMYAARSDKFTVEWIDPNRDPQTAMAAGIQMDGTTIFQRGSRKETTQGVGESDFTSTLLKVISDEQKTVYFLTGHKERSIDSSDQQGLSQLKTALEQNNYKTASIDLTTSPTLTVQSTVLVIAAPKSDLLPDEEKVLTSYIDGGGKVLFLQDPAGPEFVNKVLQPYGVTVENGVVIDPGYSAPQSPAIPIIPQMQGATNPITKDLGRTAFPATTSVSTTNPAPSGVKVTPMLQTTAQSWLVRPPDRQDARFDSNTDMKGPLNIGALVEFPAKTGDAAEKGTTRIAVLGNSLFATNQFLMAIEGNRDLFVNTINWLTQSEQLISIGPKPPDTRQVFLANTQMELIRWSSMIFLPAIILALGGVVWWRRR